MQCENASEKLACSACCVYLRTETGASCLPLAELEGKVSAGRLTDEVFIKSFAVRQTQIYPKCNDLVGRKNESTDFEVCALFSRPILNSTFIYAEQQAV